MSPTDRRLATPALELLRGSGLDTSSGTDFIRDRIVLFAAITTCVGGAFLIFSLILRPETYPVPLVTKLAEPAGLAHIVAVALAGAIWVFCRRRPLSLPTLGALDALGLIVVCGMWAFRVDPERLETTYIAILAVTETVLARSIVVPSKSGRTLRLTIAAHMPLAAAVWLQLGRMPVFTAVGQVLWAVATVSIATITSRVIYDLRRSLREARDLGPYALEERLGAGGMGEVWRARHRLLVRAAAVKLIRPELLVSGAGDAELLLRRFEREARATAALRSPHTVQLYDFGQADDGTLFYVMEMLTGIDLEKLIERFGPLPAERAIHLLKQVCDSLAEAHRNGLTHRDIKPANIFVSGAGTELDFVKVLDFGLVRLTRERPSGDAVKLTGDGAVGCTPAFAAPEIVAGDESYDHRVDIYALGCVGYWLLTGKLVFEGETPMKVMLAHVHQTPPPPGTRTELAIPDELEHIIMDCLEKDPARRPASAVELSHRLTRCPVAQPWTDERAERWWRAHLPEHLNERPVADVLLAHEGGPLTLRRAQKI